MHPFNFSCIPNMLKMQKDRKMLLSDCNNYELHESRKRQPNFQLKTAELKKKKSNSLHCWIVEQTVAIVTNTTFIAQALISVRAGSRHLEAPHPQ